MSYITYLGEIFMRRKRPGTGYLGGAQDDPIARGARGDCGAQYRSYQLRIVGDVVRVRDHHHAVCLRYRSRLRS